VAVYGYPDLGHDGILADAKGRKASRFKEPPVLSNKHFLRGFHSFLHSAGKKYLIVQIIALVLALQIFSNITPTVGVMLRTQCPQFSFVEYL
jgi:hypothetical protein